MKTVIQRQPVHGDVAFFVQQGAKALNKNISLIPSESMMSRPYSLEYMLWDMQSSNLKISSEINSLPVDMIFRSEDSQFLYKLTKLPTINSEKLIRDTLYKIQGNVIEVMRKGMMCVKDSSVVDIVDSPAYEYVSTHQTAALLFAMNRQCISLKEYEETIPYYISRVKNELDSTQQLSDLQLERAAVLTLVGRQDLVPQDLINKIANSQRKDGFWLYEDNISPKFIPQEHTSAFAYYVLAVNAKRGL